MVVLPETTIAPLVTAEASTKLVPLPVVLPTTVIKGPLFVKVALPKVILEALPPVAN